MFNKILIDFSALLDNLSVIRARVKDKMICAMVKANAYGVGLKQVVKILDGKVDFFGVSNIAEARQVRRISPCAKVLIVTPACQPNLPLDFSYTCGSKEDVELLATTGKPYKIHLKINTGMNRYGIKSLNEFKSILSLLKGSNLVLEGIFTHFATTDEYVDDQLKVFKKYLGKLKRWRKDVIIHADNSRVSELKNHDFDMVRVGFDLYNNPHPPLLAVAEICTQIVSTTAVKCGELVGYDRRYVAKQNMRIGVVPLGYADGMDMSYVGLHLNVEGKRCQILNICMDCFMLNITDTGLKKGSRIFLLNAENPLSLYADYANTSTYEVMTKFSHARLSRHLVHR